MNPRQFRLLSFGFLGVAACAVLWLGASGAFGGSPGGTVTWKSVFAWNQRDWPGVPQMTTAELARHLGTENEKPLLIDTRSREEYAVSHLPGAVWAEKLGQMPAALRDVPREHAVVLYCSVGVRSSKSSSMERARRLAAELAQPAHKYTNLLEKVGSKIIICSYCAGAYEVTDKIKSASLPLVDEFKGHPSFRKLIEDGFQLLVF